MTITELNDKLTMMMKQFISQRDHIDTGRMYKTTRFNCTYSESGGLRIKYTAPYYIQYLDRKQFTNDFLDLPGVGDVIATFVAFQLESSFDI